MPLCIKRSAGEHQGVGSLVLRIHIVADKPLAAAPQPQNGSAWQLLTAVVRPALPSPPRVGSRARAGVAHRGFALSVPLVAGRRRGCEHRGTAAGRRGEL